MKKKLVTFVVLCLMVVATGTAAFAAQPDSYIPEISTSESGSDDDYIPIQPTLNSTQRAWLPSGAWTTVVTDTPWLPVSVSGQMDASNPGGLYVRIQYSGFDQQWFLPNTSQNHVRLTSIPAFTKYTISVKPAGVSDYYTFNFKDSF